MTNVVLSSISTVLIISMLIGMYLFFYFMTVPKRVSDFGTELTTMQDAQCADIAVQVSGAVNKPGVVNLDCNSRIIDAIASSGGFTEDANLEYISMQLNQALQVKDGALIHIPRYDNVSQTDFIVPQATQSVASSVSTEIGSTPPPSSLENAVTTISSSNSEGVSGTYINVNSATLEELVTLKGIGETYASRIIDNRPYTDLAEFQINADIPQSTIDKIKNEISF